MKWMLYPISEFGDHQAQWDLLNQGFSETPLLHTGFVIPLLKYFATGNELLAISGNVNSPRAMAILCKDKFGAWRTFQPSQAPLGTWLQDSSDSVDSTI